MEPIILNNIPDEVLLDDIKELTQEFPIEFPNLFKQIKDYLNVDTQNIYITDFVEDENNSDYFYGYLFDILSRKMYKYSFEKDKDKNTEEGLRYLIINNSGSIDVYMNYGDLYISAKQAEGYVKEGKRLKRLFKIKELREFEMREKSE